MDYFFNTFADLPKFGEPLQNVTVPVGREAVLQCVVDNLQTYKVSERTNTFCFNNASVKHKTSQIKQKTRN